MYAVIKSGGKQYKVSVQEKIKLEKLEGQVGDSVAFEEVLLLVNDQEVEVGKPYLEKAKVLAQITEHGKSKKVHIIKFRRRKNYLKKNGHRQQYTEVQITHIGKE